MTPEQLEAWTRRQRGKIKGKTRNINGRLLHRDRRLAGVSLSQIADLLGVSSVVLSLWLKHDYLPDSIVAQIEEQLSAPPGRWNRQVD